MSSSPTFEWCLFLRRLQYPGRRDRRTLHSQRAIWRDVCQLRQGYDRVSFPHRHVPSAQTLTAASIRTSYNTDQLDSSRATINMVHNNVSLTVSQDEAAKADDEAKRRLLAIKKLSLVVDLDQTIIHATVDPTVGDWQKDAENPNHDAVKDVRAFLLDDDVPGKPGCWYYIKLRPGLEEFLENVSKMYELHIYTMGTRAYAKNIADIIDPEQKIFGDRILSRTESGSMTAKNLQRLFPVDTKMVVIIDDRGDVWKWSANLIKVTPYDFFVGIGDINSSFLPKRPGPRPAPKAITTASPKPNGELPGGSAEGPKPIINGTAVEEVETLHTEEPTTPIVNSDASPLEHLVAMGNSDDATTREAQTSSQQETVDKQLEERPLLQKQKQLEAEDAAIESAAAGREVGDSQPTTDESSQPKHNLLTDNDRELFRLEDSLRSVHDEFFSIYNQQLAASSGGRLGQLRGAQKRSAPTENSDLDLIPDIKTVLPSVKAKVLGGLVIVFSGIVPLGMDVATTDIGILAKGFGARIDDKVTRQTTHLVAARNRTSKVTDAKKRRVVVVTPQWLSDSVASWARKPEEDYLLDPTEESRTAPLDDSDILSSSESPTVESSDSETEIATATNTNRNTPKPDLRIDTQPPSTEADDTEPEFDFSHLNGSPAGGTKQEWAEMGKEAEEFFGDLSSDSEVGEGFDPYDDDEGDGVKSVDSNASSSRMSVNGRKRERAGTESGEEGGGPKGRKRQALGNGLTSLNQTTNVEASDDDDEDEVADRRVNSRDDDNEGGDAAADAVDGWREAEAEAEADEDDDDGWGSELAKEFEEEMRKAQSEEEQGEG